VKAAMIALVLAATRAGVTLPDTMPTADRTLVLNGVGIRTATVFHVKVYVAGLYLPSKTQSPTEIISAEEPKRLDMVFVRDVSRSDVVEAFDKGFARSAENAPALRGRIAMMESWLGDVKRGDRLSFRYLPGRGLEVAVRGATRGIVPGNDFSRAFFAIFVGPRPADEDLKKGLLGQD
jgi:hypothetical protein